MAEKKHSRANSESPVDPNIYPHQDNSPTGTLTTTITAHNNESRRSLRNVLTRSRSSEMRASQAARDFAAADEQQRVRSMQAVSPTLPTDTDDTTRFSPDPNPSWWTSDLAPQPLRVSRPPSEEHRPYTAESEGHKRKGSEDSYVSFSYPGRVRSASRGVGDGIKRTESGGETYWPDGVEETERRAVSRAGSARSVAREAGRAY
jgi:hypothetical protein